MIINLILRLVIWFLLTADFSLPNIAIGLLVAFILPGNYTGAETLKEWFKVLSKIPQAYLEALEIMIRPHNQEEVTMEKVKIGRSPRLIFLDIFLITFTPKTIVLKSHEEGWYEVHWVRRRKQTL